MSFLDNLENNLKSLESGEQARDDADRERRARDHSRAATLAAAPHAEALRKSPFTAEILKQATRVGFSLRTKIHVAWLGSTLRLEAREKRLELRPTAKGVVAVYIEGGNEVRTEDVNLTGDAEKLVRDWLQ
jgi:hypothetical protein